MVDRRERLDEPERGDINTQKHKGGDFHGWRAVALHYRAVKCPLCADSLGAIINVTGGLQAVSGRATRCFTVFKHDASLKQREGALCGDSHRKCHLYLLVISRKNTEILIREKLPSDSPGAAHLTFIRRFPRLPGPTPLNYTKTTVKTHRLESECNTLIVD